MKHKTRANYKLRYPIIPKLFLILVCVCMCKCVSSLHGRSGLQEEIPGGMSGNCQCRG